MPKKRQGKRKQGSSPNASARGGGTRKGSGPKGVLILIAVAAVGLLAYYTFGLSGVSTARSLPSQGNQHIQPGVDARFKYNSDPPTSGPHYTHRPPWGIHTRPLPKGLQIHGLEDGGVIVQYNCTDCSSLIAKLRGIVNRYSEYVILAPYPTMKSRIALTAWTKLDALEEFDENRVVRFIRAYRGIDHHR